MRFTFAIDAADTAVIIVALIDVLIVLLIFPMVTSIVRQQPALRLALPESSQAQKTGANENASLVVSIDAQGGLRSNVNARPITGVTTRLSWLRSRKEAWICESPSMRMCWRCLVKSSSVRTPPRRRTS